MKRLYKTVAVEAHGAGYRVLLDGRPVRTPAKAALSLPTPGLAAAAAEEWRAQGDSIDPSTMPMTRLGCAAIDLIGPQRGLVIETVTAYGETELLCYRAPEPPELVERQAAAWGPLLEWLNDRHGVRLAVTAGVAPVGQDGAAIDRLRSIVADRDDWALAALNAAVTAAGSLVVGLALMGGRLTAEAAFEVSQLDESYQIERWGEDFEATERRRDLARQLGAAERFAALSRR